eukprot:UN0592
MATSSALSRTDVPQIPAQRLHDTAGHVGRRPLKVHVAELWEPTCELHGPVVDLLEVRGHHVYHNRELVLADHGCLRWSHRPDSLVRPEKRQAVVDRRDAHGASGRDHALELQVASELLTVVGVHKVHRCQLPSVRGEAVLGVPAKLVAHAPVVARAVAAEDAHLGDRHVGREPATEELPDRLSDSQGP